MLGLRQIDVNQALECADVLLRDFVEIHDYLELMACQRKDKLATFVYVTQKQIEWQVSETENKNDRFIKLHGPRRAILNGKAKNKSLKNVAHHGWATKKI